MSDAYNPKPHADNFIFMNTRVFHDLLKELSATVTPNHHLLKIQKVLFLSDKIKK